MPFGHRIILSPNPRLCQVEIHDKKQIIDSLKRALQESQDLLKFALNHSDVLLISIDVL